MIEIKHLTKTFNKKKALNNITLTIPKGQIIGLFGENGSGKTTFMKSILGLIKFQGEITLDGNKINYKVMDKFSFAASEHSFFPSLTANDHAVFYKEHFPKFSAKRFDSLMNFFSLPMNKALKHFSTGQKNQFEVILSLSQGADYILMQYQR